MATLARDARLVFIAKTTRTFCYGSLGVLFPVYLTELGLDARGLGIAVTLALLSSAVLTVAVRRPAQRWGPRTALLGLAALSVLAALLFLVAKSPWLVIVAAMLGNLAVGTGESGPFLALEQVAVTRASTREGLTRALSLYNLTGYVASALGAALVTRLTGSPTWVFAIFLAGAVIQLGAYALMRRSPPVPASARARQRAPSRALVRRIAALFALDSFAGGFVIQSLVTYWFYTRFDLALGTLGWIFFGTQILSGLSLLLAARLAPRLGLVNTMVFSHLISNLLLIALAFASTLSVAVTLLLARHLLSQMDLPTRQTFLMLAVEDQEREHAATLTNTTRTVAQSVSPAVTGWIMQTLSLSAPFLLGGGLKIVYDLLLYATIRNIRTR
ncbi:MAG TPA: MFS transporter [Candidatus Nitrosocosmicus sp.]|jgi:MFS family permease|nr:MFS transporter [Candidatus Nitrosocosmicus sp.]